MALNYEMLEELTFRVNAGAEVNTASTDRYIPIGLSAGGKLDGDALKTKSSYYTIINENILTYDKKFNRNHALNLMGGVLLSKLINTTNFKDPAQVFCEMSMKRII